MFLAFLDDYCWVIEPSEYEQKALRWYERQKWREQGAWTPFALILSAAIAILVAVGAAVLTGSPIAAIVVVSVLEFVALLWIFGVFGRHYRATVKHMEHEERIIRLEKDPEGIALCNHVLFVGDRLLSEKRQREVLRRLDGAGIRALDDFLARRDNSLALRKLIAIESNEEAYRIYVAELQRRAAGVFASVSMRDDIGWYRSTEAAENAVRHGLQQDVLNERRQRQLREARQFAGLSEGS